MGPEDGAVRDTGMIIIQGLKKEETIATERALGWAALLAPGKALSASGSHP